MAYTSGHWQLQYTIQIAAAANASWTTPQTYISNLNFSTGAQSIAAISTNGQFRLLARVLTDNEQGAITLTFDAVTLTWSEPVFLIASGAIHSKMSSDGAFILISQKSIAKKRQYSPEPVFLSPVDVYVYTYNAANANFTRSSTPVLTNQSVQAMEIESSADQSVAVIVLVNPSSSGYQLCQFSATVWTCGAVQLAGNSSEGMTYTICIN